MRAREKILEIGFSGKKKRKEKEDKGGGKKRLFHCTDSYIRLFLKMINSNLHVYSYPHEESFYFNAD